MLKEGIVLGERYEIISRIGAGGMADVYKAQDHKLNRLVAVKVMKAEFREDTSFVAKFQKEAQAAAKLSHPNVVNVYDVGEDRGLYYIVMELIEGITLKNYIARKGKLSVKEATSIAIQVSLGLEAAHNVGIIHRDVKPQNIIISTDGKVKLSDFGIAKAINSNTITANVMGSVHYSSPEQVRGGFSDAKSDIYSLGITMYEMVTGRVPFDGDTTVAIAIKHLQEEIVPPSIYTPDLPYSLEQIILKCTQKDPGRRYANIGNMIDDLKQSLIDPQGNFVQIAPLTTPGAGDTTQVTAAEMQQIRSRSTGDTDTRPSRAEMAERRRARMEKERLTRIREEDDDEDDEDERTSAFEKVVTIGGFILGAVIILILILFIGNMAGLFHFGRSSRTAENTTTATTTVTATPTPTPVVTQEGTNTAQVTVPDMIGLTVDQATETANKLGIGVRQTGMEASESIEEGRILSQNPSNGVVVDQGTTIEVVTSSGRPTIAVPTGMAGLSQDEVENRLLELGLRTEVELQYSDTVDIGYVISVTPSEGSQVPPDSTVKVYVSKGVDQSNYVTIPDMYGVDEVTARGMLESIGLTSETVTGESDFYAFGQVMIVNPEVGTLVAPGTVVTLTINNYVAPTPLPQVNSAYVCYSPLSPPDGYNGGQVELVLVQNGTSTTFYVGANPWADGNVYNTPITSDSGETGEIEVYEDGILIARYPNVVFEAVQQ